MPTTKAKKKKPAKADKKKKKSKASRNGKKGKAAKKTKKSTKKAQSKKAKSAKKAASSKKSKSAKKSAKSAKKAGSGNGRPRSAAAAKDKRQLVQERKILRSQSRWLQKALFALSKAEDDQVKLADVRGDSHEPMAVTINGTTHQVGAVTDSLRDSVMDRLERLRVSLRNEHSLLG